MPKLVKSCFGKLANIKDIQTGQSYPESDWRMSHVDKPGIIVVYESLRQAPGKYFIILYHDEDIWDPDMKYIRTSCGDILEDTEDELYIRTFNSEYLFLLGDFGLDENRKATLVMNALETQWIL